MICFWMFSGGKLELPKCGYHVIYYDFNEDGVPYMRHTQQESITLVNESEQMWTSKERIYIHREQTSAIRSPPQGIEMLKQKQ